MLRFKKWFIPVLSKLVSLRAKRSNLIVKRLLRRFASRNDTLLVSQKHFFEENGRHNLDTCGFIPLKNRANRGRKNFLRGFTFIEILIASTIFAVVSAAVYGTFNSGISIWRRAENFNLEARIRLLKLEKINRELRSAFVFKKQELYFNGNKSRIEIPVIADSEINKVTYSYDPAKKMLFRSSDKLADIVAAKEKNETITSREVSYISDVDGLTYSYFYFDLQKAAYAWRDDWQQEILPLAVRINITFIDETYTASIFIPSA